jgi:hypothetical protein
VDEAQTSRSRGSSYDCHIAKTAAEAARASQALKRQAGRKAIDTAVHYEMANCEVADVVSAGYESGTADEKGGESDTRET